MERLIEILESETCGNLSDLSLLMDVMVTELRNGMVVITDCTVRATPNTLNGEVCSVNLKAERILATEIDGDVVTCERSFVGEELGKVLENHKELEIFAETKLANAMADKDMWV